MRIESQNIPIQPATRPAPTERPAPDDVRAGLSSDELSYFADLERMGPLTYGRRGATAASLAPPVAIGQRLDVRA